jgi:hypothetical protein
MAQISFSGIVLKSVLSRSGFFLYFICTSSLFQHALTQGVLCREIRVFVKIL